MYLEAMIKLNMLIGEMKQMKYNSDIFFDWYNSLILLFQIVYIIKYIQNIIN